MQVSGDSLSIYKGYSLPQKTEEYLVSHGLKGASYSISAAGVNEGLFGRLLACPYQVLGTLSSYFRCSLILESFPYVWGKIHFL